MKACSSCGAVKPLAEFRLLVRATKKPCRLGKCLDCERAAARERMKAQRESGRAWENAKRWREENRERYLNLKRAETNRRRDRLGLPPTAGKRRATEEERAAAMAERQAQAEADRADRRHIDALRHIAKRTIPRAGWTNAEWFAWMYKNNPAFNAKQRIRASLRRSATRYGWVPQRFGNEARGRAGRKLWALLGYSPDDLRQHLERQFTKGMTWDRFLAAEIHIDHIVPVSSFDLDSEDDVRACYCLSNLRPLWAGENLAKSARMELLV